MMKRTCIKALLCMALALGLHGAVTAQFQSTGAPYVPTPAAVIDVMLQSAFVGPNDFVIDLGSGDGRIVIEAAKKYGARGVGVELDVNLAFAATEDAKRQGVAAQVNFVRENLFDYDVGRATVLALYLSGPMNAKLRPRILAQMRPGTRVVSHDFDMGEWKPDQRREVAVPNKPYGPPVSIVYLWYVPASVAGKWRWQLAFDGATHAYELAVGQRFQDLSGEALVDGGNASWAATKLTGDLISFTLTREQFGQQVRHEFKIGRAHV